MTQRTRTVLSRVAAVLGLAMIFLFTFRAVSFAAGPAVPDDGGSILEQARPIYETLVAGHYLAGAAFALAFAVALAKRYAPGKAGAFLHTDVGGTLATLAMAFFGAAATSLVAFKGFDGFSFGMLIASGKIAAMAAGGYALIKKLIVEPFRASSWYAKSPAWVKAALQVVMWMFDKRAAAADKIAEAEQAGADAVKANPSGGTDSPTNLGKPDVF